MRLFNLSDGRTSLSFSHVLVAMTLALLVRSPASGQDFPQGSASVISAATFTERVAPNSVATLLGSGLATEERWGVALRVGENSCASQSPWHIGNLVS